MTDAFVGTHTESGWSSWCGQNHEIEDGAVTLATDPRVRYVSPTWQVSDPDLPFDVVDLDVDDCGDIWLLAADGTLHRYDPDADDLRRIHCTWRNPPAQPTAIAVTEHTVLVAADSDPVTGSNACIHAFSRPLMQTRWVATSYGSPVALARHENTVSVLDAAEPEPTVSTLGPNGDSRDRRTGFGSPIDLAIDTTGDRYVLDVEPASGARSVERVPTDGSAVETVVPASNFEAADTGEMLTPTVLSAGVPGEVLVGDGAAQPNEHATFRYSPAAGNFERMTTYAGPVERLLLRRDDAASDPGLHVVGHDGRSLSFLTAAERTRVNPDTGRYDGEVVARLDSGERGMQWHRITTSLQTEEPGTQVRLSYHATDDPDLEFRKPGTGGVVPLTDVRGIGPITAGRLRDAYIQGIGELAACSPERVATLATTGTYYVSVGRARGWIEEARRILDERGLPSDLDWQSVGPPDPRDALLEEAEGRYLWVKAELVGTAAAAPRLHSLRAYFPRESYLRYLPDVYQTDAEMAAFLERFLSLFESTFTEVEEEISATTRYLDPDGVPSEALSWLEGWLALAPDGTWSTADERELLRSAPDLFKSRGTRRGLDDLLDIYLGDPTFSARWRWFLDRQADAIDRKVANGELSSAEGAALKAMPTRKHYIWEHQDLSCIEDPDAREVYEQVFPCPQCVAVMVWPSIGPDRIREVERLVDTTTPAHAITSVIPLQPSLRLTDAEGDTGYSTFLGVNSVLGERDFELGSSGLGTETELSTHEDASQLDETARLGTDTRMS